MPFTYLLQSKYHIRTTNRHIYTLQFKRRWGWVDKPKTKRIVNTKTVVPLAKFCYYFFDSLAEWQTHLAPKSKPLKLLELREISELKLLLLSIRWCYNRIRFVLRAKTVFHDRWLRGNIGVMQDVLLLTLHQICCSFYIDLTIIYFTFILIRDTIISCAWYLWYQHQHWHLEFFTICRRLLICHLSLTTMTKLMK